MRILIFSWKDIKHPQAGGSEINIHEQAKRWVACGHDVTLICPRFKNAIREEIIDGVRIVRTGGRFSVYALAPIKYLLRFRLRCDVIIDIENGIPFFTPIFSSKPKVALMHHVHQNVFFTELPFPLSIIAYSLENKLMPLVYRSVPFISVSESTKKSMVTTLKMKGNNITIIHNGLNHKKFKLKLTKSKHPVIIYFGRLQKYKRVDKLISIFKQLTKFVPSAKLWIVGTGAVESALKKQVKDAHLEDSVVFFGKVTDSDSVKLLKSAWIFATCSDVEGWGITVLEAAACGTPAIAFDVPGLRDSIINNESGFLVRNNVEFTNKLHFLIKNKMLREKMSGKAKTFARNFTWDRSAEKTLAFLTERILRK